MSLSGQSVFSRMLLSRKVLADDCGVTVREARQHVLLKQLHRIDQPFKVEIAEIALEVLIKDYDLAHKLP
jgi:hypothetical protein